MLPPAEVIVTLLASTDKFGKRLDQLPDFTPTAGVGLQLPKSKVESLREIWERLDTWHAVVHAEIDSLSRLR